jgi:hypothetical protein
MPSGAIPVYVASNGNTTAVVTGQQTGTTTATALASHALNTGVTISALSSNSGVVYVGPAGITSSTGFPLTAGASVTLNVPNTNLIYVLAATGSPVVSFIGS